MLGGGAVGPVLKAEDTRKRIAAAAAAGQDPRMWSARAQRLTSRNRRSLSATGRSVPVKSTPTTDPAIPGRDRLDGG